MQDVCAPLELTSQGKRRLNGARRGKGTRHQKKKSSEPFTWFRSLRHLRFPQKCSYSRVIMIPIQIANMLIAQNEIILSSKRKQDTLIALLFLKRLLEFLEVAQIRRFHKSFCVYTAFKQLLQ